MTKMSPKLDSRTFVFATIANEYNALMLFRESEGVTLILEQEYASAARLESVFACRRITLEVHSALDAVGFLAAIIPVLAKEGMGVNPVSGYFHDHLFVPADRAEDALEILQNLSGGSSNS